MDTILSSRIALYQEAIVLEQKRSELQAELDRLMARLGSLRQELFDDDGYASSGVSVAGGRFPGGRARRGELKSAVLRALAASGSAGVRVKDLAATLGAKATNIHSWFQTAVKRFPQIKKIDAARYRLEGTIPQAEFEVKTKSSRKSDAFLKRSTRPLSGRGELAAKIIDALKKGGTEGVRVTELAKKLEVNSRNLFIWFSTTGKNKAGIEKVGPGHYRYIAE